MPCTRKILEERERRVLAPYAQLSAESRGRDHRESPPKWRTEYQRDRDRVIHSRAFRRLEHKTQVFLNGSGDHLRSRLTHTMEVAAISRNISRALGINEDLTETISLAHDLGHSPFGHKGETVLNRLMKDHGGFEHNQQSLCVVEELETKYPFFPGLNLTWEVREGLAKHSKSREENRSVSLEAQVADLADEIAYYSHDLDDGLESRLLQEKKLFRDVEIWRQAANQIKNRHGALPDESRRYFIIRCLIDSQITDVVTVSERWIQKARIHSSDSVRALPEPLIRYSPKRTRLNRELREYLYENLYYNPIVYAPNFRAVTLLEELFQYYLDNPSKMPPKFRQRLRVAGRHRAICDYIACMTDGFAMQEHARLLA